jgi:endonuclease YncB( thermonuclease family)
MGLSGRRVGALAAIGAVLMTAVPALAVTADRPADSLRCVETRGHHDGDTFTCIPESGEKAFIVRVASIDAPETGQEYWRVARARLRELAAPGSTVGCYKVDRFHREVCRLKTSDGRNAADVMLSEGLAWYAEDFSADDEADDRERYRRLETEAREAGRGLWASPNPMPPKQCRELRRARSRCR